jgi:hypothetical protein
VSTLTDLARWYVLGVAITVAVIGSFHWPRWFRTLDFEGRMVWLAVAGLNFAIGYGTGEGLAKGLPGGPRNLIVAVCMTWLLFAIAYRPVRQVWRWWLRRRLSRRT